MKTCINIEDEEEYPITFKCKCTYEESQTLAKLVQRWHKKPAYRLGVILEGEEAREFEDRMKDEITDEQRKFFREAIKLYKRMED